MQYRRFGKLDWQVSALGFGCMRLPVIGGVAANIDEPEAARMLHYAIEHGVNYLDTAYPYHGENSERFLGRALKGGYREKVRLATKMPAWKVESAQDFTKLLDEQMLKLQVDYIDFYLLHGMGKERWAKLSGLGILDWADKALASGRFGGLGFSFHDSFDVFKQIVDAYDRWTLCQIQYNYMDIEHQAGTRGLQYAASKGLAVVVMEPLLGGKLVDPPASVQAVWDRASVKRSAADWALRWLWSQPEVSLALSGMSTMQQVQENVELASHLRLHALTDEELALYPEVRARYEELSPIGCTKCDYCQPCPNGVEIPRNFDAYNQGAMYAKPDAARRGYQFIAEAGRATKCLECLECETKCPQNLPIVQWLKVVEQVLGQGKPYESVARPT